MKTWQKLLIAAIILLSGAAAYVYFYVYNKAHEDYETTHVEFRIGAKTLYEAYVSDTAAANLKYGGKVLEISGALDTIENHDDTLIVAVFVFDQGMFGPQGVRCSFLPKYLEAAQKLKSNAPITIKGVCQGYTDSDVIIESASLVE